MNRREEKEKKKKGDESQDQTEPIDELASCTPIGSMSVASTTSPCVYWLFVVEEGVREGGSEGERGRINSMFQSASSFQMRLSTCFCFLPLFFVRVFCIIRWSERGLLACCLRLPAFGSLLESGHVGMGDAAIGRERTERIENRQRMDNEGNETANERIAPRFKRGLGRTGLGWTGDRPPSRNLVRMRPASQPSFRFFCQSGEKLNSLCGCFLAADGRNNHIRDDEVAAAAGAPATTPLLPNFTLSFGFDTGLLDGGRAGGQLRENSEGKKRQETESEEAAATAAAAAEKRLYSPKTPTTAERAVSKTKQARGN